VNEYYLQIRFVHVLCVILSGSLFSLRGIAVLAGAPAANHSVVRWLSYAIDTTLLTAALMLASILRQYPFVDAWLTTKVLLLVLYIVLGSFALRRARSARVRAACFAGAIATYLYIVGVALAHDPRGFLLVLQ
jgi:uncharacterized membrane protein SirB2